MTSETRLWARTSLKGDEIRVLEYDSAESLASGILACRTKVLRLTDIRHGRAAPYVALSYVWGEKAVTRPLVCDSTVMDVTRNLEQAITTIWKAHPSMRLWADAVCITQDDVAERSHQVSLMGDSFSPCKPRACLARACPQRREPILGVARELCRQRRFRRSRLRG